MLVDKAMCPIPEVARLLGRSAKSIVEEANAGGLQLYVKVPEELQVISVHSYHLNPSPILGRTFPHRAFLVPDLQFLALRQNDLRAVYKVGTLRVDSFDAGVSFDKEGMDHHLQASILEVPVDAWRVEKLTLPARCYALYSTELELCGYSGGRFPRPRPVEVTWENLYVSRTDILRLQPLLSAQKVELIELIQLPEGRHISADLQKLREELLAEFSLASGNGHIIPSRDALVSKLKPQFAHKANRAKAGAQVLHRSLSTLLSDKPTAMGNEVPVILHLFECAQKFWGDSADVADRRPRTEDIALWLEKRFAIHQSTAMDCVALIRPEWSQERGRRPSVSSATKPE